jgi:hypothetical protein
VANYWSSGDRELKQSATIVVRIIHAEWHTAEEALLATSRWGTRVRDLCSRDQKNSFGLLLVVFERGAELFAASNGRVTRITPAATLDSLVPRHCGRGEGPSRSCPQNTVSGTE